MKRKILVVDDERIVADTLGIIFQKRGFDCRVTYSGSDAITSSEEFCPDLLLCDLSLPDMNGLDAVSIIIQNCPNCRVLLLTGHYSRLDAAREWSRDNSVLSRVLVKPLPPLLLLQEVAALLDITSE